MSTSLIIFTNSRWVLACPNFSNIFLRSMISEEKQIKYIMVAGVSRQNKTNEQSPNKFNRFQCFLLSVKRIHIHLYNRKETAGRHCHQFNVGHMYMTHAHTHPKLAVLHGGFQENPLSMIFSLFAFHLAPTVYDAPQGTWITVGN